MSSAEQPVPNAEKEGTASESTTDDAAANQDKSPETPENDSAVEVVSDEDNDDDNKVKEDQGETTAEEVEERPKEAAQSEEAVVKEEVVEHADPTTETTTDAESETPKKEVDESAEVKDSGTDEKEATVDEEAEDSVAPTIISEKEHANDSEEEHPDEKEPEEKESNEKITDENEPSEPVKETDKAEKPTDKDDEESSKGGVDADAEDEPEIAVHTKNTPKDSGAKDGDLAESEENVAEDATMNVDDDEPKTPAVQETDESPPSAVAAKLSVLPIPFRAVDGDARTYSHSKLRSYESRRRAAYGSKLSSSSLYWRSFRELVKRSLAETRRAERIILSRVLASEAFAAHMQAIHDDVLEEDTGRPITDPKKKKKFLAKREKERKKESGVSSSDVKEEKSSSPSSFTLGESNGVLEDKHGSLLKPLIDSHGVLANRYNESTKIIREQVTEEISNLRKQLEDKIMTMEALGDAIMEELEAAEEEVMEAWDIYFVESSQHTNGEETETSGQRLGAAFNDLDVNPQKNCSDTWIREMHYRMAVAYLSSCWEKCSAELSRLFTSLKVTEVSRRHRLRELLLTFLEKEESLWVGLPATITPVLKAVVERPTDRRAIEDNVQNCIKMRAQAIQREEQSTRRQEAVGPGLSSDLAKEGNFELSSPLLSDLMVAAKVVEKKESGMMRSWKTVLAIVTADSFLHLFDVPSKSDLQTGSAVEVAFHALVPPVEIPTVNNVKTGFAPKAWNQYLTPSDSMVLPNSRIVFDDDGKNTAFEMHETVFNKGAKTMFGKTTSKRVFFRTRTHEETAEWIGSLIANKMTV